MLLAPALGRIHQELHPPAWHGQPALGHTHIHSAAQSATGEGACGPWLLALFSGHGHDDCQLHDQLNAWASPPTVAQVLPTALPRNLRAMWRGEAHPPVPPLFFDPRAPPLALIFVAPVLPCCTPCFPDFAQALACAGAARFRWIASIGALLCLLRKRSHAPHQSLRGDFPRRHRLPPGAAPHAGRAGLCPARLAFSSLASAQAVVPNTAETTLSEVTVSAGGLGQTGGDMTTPASILEGQELVLRREATLGETLALNLAFKRRAISAPVQAVHHSRNGWPACQDP